MEQEKFELFNLENEKYKDLTEKITLKNKVFEYDLKKRAIQLIKF